MKIRKLLVANRGEIAVRVMQTCREMGIRTVGVYSSADRSAMHVRAADESLHIGDSPAASSYLSIDRVVDAALRSGAEAVHPGYGFLSEKPAFAEACERAGLVFVGPGPSSMQLLGSKSDAKRLARQAGVPVVPGYDGPDQDDEALVTAAADTGFPLLIKAWAGGGGKGMRVVRSADELRAALESARREALNAFGDASVLIERYIERPRHIEVQVLADSHGNIVHLGERDCSTQRRHQKVIEETPAPGLSPGTRQRIGADAVSVIRAAGYVNAATVEFILDPNGNHYFLEVNTRLQVEHPVTEEVTGLDLVREQIRISSGLPLAVSQDAVRPSGHALECRVYAEDAYNSLLPSTGQLAAFRVPSGAGIRNDLGVERGDTVTAYYDPMLAKLIVHAPDRDQCVARARQALRDYSIAGVRHNLPLLRAILDSTAFGSGAVTTDWLDSEGVAIQRPAVVPMPVLAAVAVRSRASAAASRDPWSSPFLLGRGHTPLRYLGKEIDLVAEIDPDGTCNLSAGGGSYTAEVVVHSDDRLTVRHGTHVEQVIVSESGGTIYAVVDGETYELERPHGLTSDDIEHDGTRSGPSGGLQSPMPGTVVKVPVSEGDAVAAGQVLLVLEAMKMEHSITAPQNGVVRRLFYHTGDQVPAGALLAELGSTE